MIWKRISLTGFLPFTHSNIKHVEINFDKPCTAILGQNGCGKSSLLREMSVWPAVRTNYVKDGKITKVVEHKGHIYEMTSDFSNSSAPHSFKMNGQELNPSGTTDVQRDLVEEHLEINQLFSDILAGNVHICDMQKAHRKQLFSATYPSDLSFVLEYHKKVCSQIRAFGNQIKLLQGREGSLLTSLLDENERTRLESWKNNAQSLITRIDQINLLIDAEISQLSNSDALKQNYIEMAPDQIKSSLKNYVDRFRSKLLNWSSGKKFGEDLDIESLGTSLIEFEHAAEYASKKRDSLTAELESVRNEIDKFTRLKNTPTSDKKDELANELRLIKEEMEKLKSDPNWQNAPAVQQNKMSAVEILIPDLISITAALHPYAGKLIGNDTIQKLNAENDTLAFSCSSLRSELVGIEHQLNQLKSRREMITQNSYPKDCDRVCGLRATLEASVRDIDLQISEMTVRANNLKAHLEDCSKRLDSNKQVLQEVSPAIPVMKRLFDRLSENYLVDLALNGENFVTCLNEHCAEIPNRIVKGIESAKIYYRYKELYDRSESISNSLSMMDTNEFINLSTEVIEEAIRDRQNKLDAGIDELKRLDRQIEELTTSRSEAADMCSTLNNIQSLIDNTRIQFNACIVNSRIEFDRQIIQENTSVRNVLSEKLREVEHTLNNQRRILDILETEIRPTLEDLRKQKTEWEMVEYGLSPTKGLPCIYLIRFINRLIEKTNKLIKEIWFCDMELAYLDEKDNLDFTLGLILNKSTTVKDISLCSNGQKAVIDLCFTLALCKERNLMSYTISLDECDAALTEQHRTNLVALLSRMLDDHEIHQLMLVNHFALQTGIAQCDCVCLSPEGILLPSEYNTNATIE